MAAKKTFHEKQKMRGVIRSGVHFTPEESDLIRSMAAKAGLTPNKYIHDVTVAAATAGMLPVRAPPTLRAEHDDDA